MVYWADSIGRRNTFDYFLFEQPVEGFGGSSPAEGFAGPCVQSMGDRAQLIDAVLAEIRALWKVFSQQAVGIFVAPALPRTARQAYPKDAAERGLCGSQKWISSPESIWSCACWAISAP